jgi:hypothetical protein
VIWTEVEGPDLGAYDLGHTRGTPEWGRGSLGLRYTMALGYWRGRCRRRAGAIGHGQAEQKTVLGALNTGIIPWPQYEGRGERRVEVMDGPLKCRWLDLALGPLGGRCSDCTRSLCSNTAQLLGVDGAGPVARIQLAETTTDKGYSARVDRESDRTRNTPCSSSVCGGRDVARWEHPSIGEPDGS